MWVTVIPAYNPDSILLKLLEDIQYTGNITILVNDGSEEEHNELFQKAKEFAIVLTHKNNYGKGHAIKTALRYISRMMPTADGVVIMDADGQHTVEDMCKICREIEIYKDTLILGVRNFSRDIPVKSRLGNILTRKVFQIICKVNVSDTQTGLRGFSKQLIPTMEKIPGERYEYEMNMLFSCIKQKVPIKEVVIQTVYFDKENSCSHFRPLRDSIRIYSVILKFAGSSLCSFFVDYSAFLLFHFLFGSIANNVIISNILARIISGSFNFYLNRKYVFQSQGNKLTALLKYCIVATVILGLNTVVLSGLCNMFLIPAALAKVFTELLLFIISMVLQKYFVFKNTKKSIGGIHI